MGSAQCLDGKPMIPHSVFLVISNGSVIGLSESKTPLAGRLIYF